MKTLIIEMNSPQDFYSGKLDGMAVQYFLRTLDLEATLRFVLDKKHLKKALKEAAEGNYDIVHVSAHGNSTGIAIANDELISWASFANLFKEVDCCPLALVMACCAGSSDMLLDEFVRQAHGPGIVFGSTENLAYDDYCIAWSMLYSKFRTGGIKITPAQEALQSIVATLHTSFRYARWDSNKLKYRKFPPRKLTYQVIETPT